MDACMYVCKFTDAQGLHSFISLISLCVHSIKFKILYLDCAGIKDFQDCFLKWMSSISISNSMSLTDSMTDSMTVSLTDSLTESLTNSLTESLTDSLNEILTESLIDSLTVSLTILIFKFLVSLTLKYFKHYSSC